MGNHRLLGRGDSGYTEPQYDIVIQLWLNCMAKCANTSNRTQQISFFLWGLTAPWLDELHATQCNVESEAQLLYYILNMYFISFYICFHISSCVDNGVICLRTDPRWAWPCPCCRCSSEGLPAVLGGADAGWQGPAAAQATGTGQTGHPGPKRRTRRRRWRAQWKGWSLK